MIGLPGIQAHCYLPMTGLGGIVNIFEVSEFTGFEAEPNDLFERKAIDTQIRIDSFQ